MTTPTATPTPRTACKSCPFRSNSEMRHDAEAIELMRDLMEPNCHEIVGIDDPAQPVGHINIFADHVTEETRCIGYEKSTEGAPGFRSLDMVLCTGRKKKA